jgi:hypothetical protein
MCDCGLSDVREKLAGHARGTGSDCDAWYESADWETGSGSVLWIVEESGIGDHGGVVFQPRDQLPKWPEEP